MSQNEGKPVWFLAHPDRRLDPGSGGSVATIVTVIVSYLSSFIAIGAEADPSTWALLVVLGIIHLLLSLPLAERCFFHPATTAKTFLFFLLQSILVGVIHWIGFGQFWLLFLPLASTAAAMLSRRAVIAYYAVLMGAFILPFNWRDGTTALQYLLIFLCALVFVWIFTEVSVRDQQARREVERLARELGEANRRLKESAAQAEELARSRERNRLAREIHDSLGHYLTVVNVQLEAARALLENKGWRKEAPDLYAALDKAQTLTRGGLADVRRSVAALRADPMGDKSFPEAIRALIEENRETGLLVELRMEGEMRKADPQVELALFRILQEALTNVRKHARASRADVRMAYREGAVELEVADNGVGQGREEDGEEKFGLRGIRERVEILKGKMETGTSEEGGMRILVEFPLEKA
jgi:signal transduction histidine kinase